MKWVWAGAAFLVPMFIEPNRVAFCIWGFALAVMILLYAQESARTVELEKQRREGS